MHAGERLACPSCPTEVVVVRPGSEGTSMTCGAAVLQPLDLPRPLGGHTPDGPVATIGKRYADERTGLEILCTKGGAGALGVGARSMVVKSAKPLPASD